jgi:hypothetical protein
MALQYGAETFSSSSTVHDTSQKIAVVFVDIRERCIREQRHLLLFCVLQQRARCSEGSKDVALRDGLFDEGRHLRLLRSAGGMFFVLSECQLFGGRQISLVGGELDWDDYPQFHLMTHDCYLIC